MSLELVAILRSVAYNYTTHYTVFKSEYVTHIASPQWSIGAVRMIDRVFSTTSVCAIYVEKNVSVSRCDFESAQLCTGHCSAH